MPFNQSAGTMYIENEKLATIITVARFLTRRLMARCWYQSVNIGPNVGWA
jgi:hypothetical protein